jgi:hypothetical protein
MEQDQHNDAMAQLADPVIPQPPQAVQVSLLSVYRDLKDGHIRIDVPYQRGVVWSDENQGMLINSLYNNYYVPPVLMARARLPNGIYVKVCIDGKQRLTAIRRFFDGEIGFRQEDIKYYYSEEAFARKKKAKNPHALLGRTEAYNLGNCKLVLVEYSNTFSHDVELELFCRVQRGVALTQGEMLNACEGPAMVLARGLVEKYGTELGRCLRSTKRKEDLLLTLRLLAMLSGNHTLRGDYKNITEHITVEDDTEIKFGRLIRLIVHDGPAEASSASMIQTCITARCLLEAPDDAGRAFERAIKIGESLSSAKAWGAAEKLFREDVPDEV